MINSIIAECKAVIFDMDGLLINSEPIWKIAEIEGFKRANLATTEEECKQTTGLRMDEVIDYWFERKSHNGMDKVALHNFIINYMVNSMLLSGEPMPGAIETVKFFAKKGLPLAVATSSPKVLLDAVLARLQIREYFSVLCSAEFEKFGKPNPAVFITAAQKLGVPNERCLIFEDSVNGVIAAKAARSLCIAVPEKGRANDPRFTIADAVLETLEGVFE